MCIEINNCKSVEEILDRYYKPDRYKGRGEEYASVLLDSYKKEMAEKGQVSISKHDNVTGQFLTCKIEKSI